MTPQHGETILFRKYGYPLTDFGYTLKCSLLATEELLAQLDLSGTVLDSKCHPANDAGGHQPASVRKVLDTCLQKLNAKKLRIFYLRKLPHF